MISRCHLTPIAFFNSMWLNMNLPPLPQCMQISCECVCVPVSVCAEVVWDGLHENAVFVLKRWSDMKKYIRISRQSDLISRQSFGDLFSRFGDLLSHFGGLLSRLGDFNNSLWWHIYSLWIFINPLWRLINSLWRLINPLWWLINSLWRLLDICPFSASVLQYEPIWNEIMARDNQYWCYNHRPPEWHFSGAYFTNIWFNFTPTVNK